MWPRFLNESSPKKSVFKFNHPAKFAQSMIEKTSTTRGQLEVGFVLICVWATITAGIYYTTGYYFPSLTVIFVLLFGIASNFVTAVSLSLFISFFYDRMHLMSFLTSSDFLPFDVATFDHILVIIMTACVAGILGSLMRRALVEQTKLRRDAETAWRAAVKQTNLLAASESRLRTLNLTLETRVAQRTAELRGIIRHSPLAIFTRTLDGRIKIANEEFERFIGKNRAEIIGRIDSEILPPDLLRFVRDLDTKVKMSKTAYRFEHTIEYIKGDRVFYFIGFPIFNPALEVEAIGGIIKDMTDTRRIEKEKSELVMRERLANEASRLKSEFLANMSHEIRTPINGIIGMAKLLSETELSIEQKRLLRTVESSSSLLLSIINDILDLSKIEAGRIELENVTFRLKDLISDVIECYEPLISAKGLAFQKPGELFENTWLEGDPGRIRQILNNLLSNALKFTSTGSIMLGVQTVKRDDGQVDLTFSVKDTGIGISPEVRTKLFQKFYQGDTSTARKFGGTGLGLAICKRLVDLMGGQIDVASQPGTGTTFSFFVRVKNVEKSQTASFGETANHVLRAFDPSLRKTKRVLIAEDNPINQEITLRMLEKAGYQAQAVANGCEVLELINNTRFDLILMDCQMPEMDGYDATREIRRKGIKLPVIALTACAFKYDREKCLDAGMTDFVAKPVTKEELIRVVDRWIATSVPIDGPNSNIGAKIFSAPQFGEIEILDVSMISRLEQLDKDGKNGLVKKLIQMYLTMTPKAVNEIREAVDKPGPQLRKLAHTLKSSSANLGARRVATLLQKIESGEFQDHELAKIVDALEREVELAQKSLLDVLEGKLANNANDHTSDDTLQWMEIVH